MSTSFRKYTRQLAAGVEESINVSPSSVVLCFEGDSEFILKPDGQNPCTSEKGLKLSFVNGFSNLRVLSSVDQVVELYIGSGDITDNRIIGSVAIEGNPAGNASYGAVSCEATVTELLPANIARATAVLYNNGAETIFVGWDSSVAALTGLPLKSGGVMEVTNQSAVYGISESAANDVRFSEEGGA